MTTAYNYLQQTNVAVTDAVEQKHGRWYVKLGFAGFNTRANNASGYATQQAAIGAVLKHQKR